MAVSTLGLGLAAVGTTFAVIDAVLLRPLPFSHPDRIVTISQHLSFLGPGPQVSSIAEFVAWQKTGLFEWAAALDAANDTLEGYGRPERISGAMVTPDFFRVFQIQPILGREFQNSDAMAGHSDVVVLSYQLWARKFSSDPHIIGKTIRLNSAPTIVIGVMPPRFDFPRLADVSTIMGWAPEQSEYWVPLVINPDMLQSGNFNYYVLGRLRPGVTFSRAAAQFRAIAIHGFREIEAQHPEYRSVVEQLLTVFGLDVSPLARSMASAIRETLWMLLAAVGLLLVLVLFNLGNLLLTENTQRMREYAVRQALGASRRQLFRESFLEQTVLVAAGTLLSAILTFWAIPAIRAIGGNRLPRLYELHFNSEIAAVSLALSFFTAMLFGALPQLIIRDSLLARGLQVETRTATSDRRTNRIKAGLMSAQIAFSIVLLVGAGLLLQSFRNVLRVNPGFDSHNVLTLNVSFNPKNNETATERLQHTRELLATFRAIPGVESASAVNQLPLIGETEIREIRAVGKAIDKSPEANTGEYRVADSDYFRTMRIPLIAGRFFRPDDPGNFAVISQKMAARFWPGEDPIGKQITETDGPALTVIGVCGNVHGGSLERTQRMQYYRPLVANPYYVDTFVIRSRLNPPALSPILQSSVWRIDPSQPVSHIRTMDQIMRSTTLGRRFETGLLAGFAVLALFLSALGLLGLASLSVARRTREFGIRLALGATRSSIARLELARAFMMIAAGSATGLMVSLPAARVMKALLFGVTPWNLRIYAASAGVLIVSGLLATWLPAQRAATIDPSSALRYE